ncbi:TonB-dependent receptor [Epilithonimonas caeni]
MLSKKPALVLMLTMSTASFYFAQSTKDTLSKDTQIEEVILKGVTDIAKDRKTPVAVSTIKSAQIIERLGNRELPEILNTTPSVYATKSGGGFGDGGLVMRGFESRNIAVMVNGMPVNDMEGGTVYFSNWTGLSDVTSTLQVQRGLGSSKLAIASVGGTVNFLTRSADMKKGGVIRLGVGNNDYLKTSFAYNTGKSENGWATSFLMSRQAGSTYIQNSEYESYAYYFALGYKPNEKHNLQFMITSAPQWHDQRTYAPTINNYIKFNPDHDGSPDRTYNSDFGYRTDANGNRIAIANRSNYYSKPVMMLNWDWTMNEKSTLSTVLYMSNGRGGGTGDIGSVGGKGMSTFYDAEGHYDYDKIFAANAAVDVNAAGARSTLVRRSSINSHNWYGILSNFQHKINDNWNFSVGTDDRYYYGYHYQVVSDLYGASGYKDATNTNIAPNVVSALYDYKKLSWNPFGGSLAPMNERIGYSNDGEVLWYSGFGQLEYSTNQLSAFIQGSVSNQSYQRIDNFVQDGITIQQNQTVNTKSGFKDIFGYNVKGGVNYNINEVHNVFANIGFYSKQPFFNSVYPSNRQVVNPTLTNEKIFSAELGYGFRTPKFNANVNVYRTQWGDRWMRRTGLTHTLVDGSTITGYSEVSGVKEIHQGIEFDGVYKAFSFLEFQGMFSWGDYFYEGNATGSNFDDNNNPVTVAGGTNTNELYLDKVKVGGTSNNSIPQMTASLGATVKPVKDFDIYGTWSYVGKIYATMDASTFTTAGNQALKLPDFNLFDLGASYKIRLKDSAQYFTIGANVYNLFDTTYIQDGATNIVKKVSDFKTNTNTAEQAQQLYNTYMSDPNNFYKGIDKSNRVFFGFGRTWAATLSFNF